MSSHHKDDEENIYMNITVHNGFTDRTIGAEYRESRNEPLLMNPDEYEMSVVRFDMPSTGIPKLLFNFPEDFIITLSYPDEGYESQQTLQFFELDFTVAADLIWYFKQMVVSMNNAFTAAYNDIVTQYEVVNGVGSWAASGGPQQPPVLVYNSSSTLFSIYCPEEMEDSNTNRIELWMNYQLFRLFETIMTEFYGYDLPTKKDVRLVVRNFLNNYVTISTNPAYNGNFLRMDQEAKSLAEFYRVYKIVIVSESISTRRESLSVFDPSSTISDNPQSARSIGIITDFDYSLLTADADRITYLPTAEYRWVDLLSSGPLTKFDFKVYLQSEGGILDLVRLDPSKNINIKLLFRKKKKI
jgi:hypothetical protein